METKYPTPRVSHLLKVLTAQGKEDAQIILDIVQACQDALESTNGLDHAIGLVREPDDVLNSFVDDALTNFLAIAIHRTGSFEGLQWHVNIQDIIKGAVLFHTRMHNGDYPAQVYVHHTWAGAMHDANEMEVNNVAVDIIYSQVDEKGKKLKSDLLSRFHTWTK